MVTLVPELVFTGDRFGRGRRVAIDDGRIVDVGAADGPLPEHALTRPRKALLPGTVNIRCHTFQSLLRGLGEDLDFMQWRDRVLYPYSTRLAREGIYLD